MATSVVGICNIALQKVGAGQIATLNDNSREARACQTCYEPTRDKLLQKHRWRFAIKRATLAAESPAPTWGKANAFILPDDFLALVPRYPEDNSIDIDYEIENGRILTNESAPLYIRYISKVEDANTMTPLFRDLLACEMAVQLCEQITQSNTKKTALKDDADKAEKAAKKANAWETRPAISPPSSWVTERDS